MRIVVNGQQAFGQRVLEVLLERGEEVCAVYCAPDKPGRRPDPLGQAALAQDVPLHQPASFKKPDVWEAYRALEPDLCVMAYVTRFVPEDFLDIPSHGTIQYHPSLLPLHRGPSSINWPIIQGEKTTGLTIFWPDKGLDTGPILMQRQIEIGADDTLGSLYFDKLFPLGVQALLDSVDLVRDGKAPKNPQDHAKASYESWCTKDDVRIDWSKPVEEVYNLIRGANPQPGAWTTLEGKTLQVFDCAKLAGTEGTPGEITAVTEDGIAAAARDGGILIKRLRPEGEEKLTAAEFGRRAGLAKGARLG